MKTIIALLLALTLQLPTVANESGECPIDTTQSPPPGCGRK